MKNTFKKNDKIICVDDANQEPIPWQHGEDGGCVTKGMIYCVRGGDVLLVGLCAGTFNDGKEKPFHPRRFRKLGEAKATITTAEVKRTRRIVDALHPRK